MNNKEIVVQKYGGESVADFARLGKVAEHIVSVAKAGKKVVAVVSAMGKTTDQLIRLAKEICGGIPPKDELDNLLVTGEQQVASLLALKCRALGIEAISLTGWQIGLEADLKGMVKRIRKINLLAEGNFSIIVVTGFQGIIEGTERLITLGRGGSDATAVALAASLGRDECELYKDVDGVYAIDPDIVPNAIKLETISYSQMGLLASAGAKVIMPRAVALAQNLGVKIKVLLSPSLGQTTGGTLVHSGSSLEEMERSWFQPVIAIREKEVLFKISDVSNQPGAAAAIFHPLKERGINITESTQGVGENTADINILCSEEDQLSVSAELETVKQKRVAGKIAISEHPNMAQLTLVSPLMTEEPGYLARIFMAMGNAKVNNETHGGGGNTIWVTVKKDCLREAAQALAEEFQLIS